MPACLAFPQPDLATVSVATGTEGGNAMTEEAFRLRLKELNAQIDQLPADQQPRLRILAEETLARYRTNKANIDQARAALDDWRLRAKYKLFDTEAGVRERQQDREDYEAD